MNVKDAIEHLQDAIYALEGGDSLTALKKIREAAEEIAK